MLTFIKLGGSLITDKREAQTFRADLMRQAAVEIASAFRSNPMLKLVLGHGSGSFGHVAAQKHGTMQGVQTPEQWVGFVEVAYVARKLNTLVMEVLYEAGLPVIAIPPFANAHSSEGKITHMDTYAVSTALAQNLIPVVYGDVAFDQVRGGTILSTETVFDYLTEALRPTRIFLLGEVEGVYDTSGVVVSHIDTANFGQVARAIGGSGGTDVTGGMESKVRGMLELARRIEGLEIRIFGGITPGQLENALTGKTLPGTLITA